MMKRVLGFVLFLVGSAMWGVRADDLIYTYDSGNAVVLLSKDDADAKGSVAAVRTASINFNIYRGSKDIWGLNPKIVRCPYMLDINPLFCTLDPNQTAWFLVNDFKRAVDQYNLNKQILSITEYKGTGRKFTVGQSLLDLLDKDYSTLLFNRIDEVIKKIDAEKKAQEAERKILLRVASWNMLDHDAYQRHSDKLGQAKLSANQRLQSMGRYVEKTYDPVAVCKQELPKNFHCGLDIALTDNEYWKTVGVQEQGTFHSVAGAAGSGFMMRGLTLKEAEKAPVIGIITVHLKGGMPPAGFTVPNDLNDVGSYAAYRIAQLGVVKQYIQSKKDIKHWVVAGDFNFNIFYPNQYPLVYEKLRSEIFPRAEWSDASDAAENRNYKNILATVRAPNDSYQRLDYMFYTKNLTKKKYDQYPDEKNLDKLISHITAQNNMIDKIFYSDHVILYAEFEFDYTQKPKPTPPPAKAAAPAPKQPSPKVPVQPKTPKQIYDNLVERMKQEATSRGLVLDEKAIKDIVGAKIQTVLNKPKIDAEADVPNVETAIKAELSTMASAAGAATVPENFKKMITSLQTLKQNLMKITTALTGFAEESESIADNPMYGD